MKTILHVNRQILARNLKNKENDDALICRTYKGSVNTKQIDIVDDNGKVIASLLQSEKPLSCGARCFIVADDKNIKVKNAIKSNSKSG